MSRLASLRRPRVRVGALIAFLFPVAFAAADEKAADFKTTAVELTAKFRDDKSDKPLRQYAGKQVEVAGEVRESQKFAQGDGWLLRLKGCPTGKGDHTLVMMNFDPDNPDLPKARKLVEGDKVTIRGVFQINFGASVALKDPRVAQGPGAKGTTTAGAADAKPEVKATAEKFVKEAVADPKGTEDKLKGKVVELTGPVSTADPTYSRWGFTLSAGKLRQADANGLFAECAVPEDQLEKAWLLAAGQKVKVVGVLTGVDKDRVRLARCAVTELEPNPMPTARAAEVAAAYAKDAKAAARKYGDRYATKDMFLEGTVTSTKAGEYGTLVFLDGSGKVAVRVQVDKAEGEGLKPGTKVRLKATCRGYWPEEKAVLFFGRVVPNPTGKK